MIRLIALGGTIGAFLGALQPVLYHQGKFHSVPVLTVEYAVVGCLMGYALYNYMGFRRRIMQRVEQSKST